MPGSQFQQKVSSKREYLMFVRKCKAIVKTKTLYFFFLRLVFYYDYFILSSVCILPVLPLVCSLQSAFYPQSAFYRRSAVCSLRFTLTGYFRCFGRFIRRREEQWWHKTPKTAKITKKHNGHTRGKFVLIILLKKREYFKAFSVINQRYFVSHTTSYKRSNSQRFSWNQTPRKMKGHVPTRAAVTLIWINR